MASRHNLPGFPFSTRHLHCIHVFDIFISEIILFFASLCIYIPDSKMEPNDRKQRIPSTDQELSSQKLLAFLKSVPVNICRDKKFLNWRTLFLFILCGTTHVLFYPMDVVAELWMAVLPSPALSV